jgi:hypothetical protein
MRIVTTEAELYAALASGEVFWMKNNPPGRRTRGVVETVSQADYGATCARSETYGSSAVASSRPFATERPPALADDFKHGFHLEEGDPPNPTDMSLARVEGVTLDLPDQARKGRGAVALRQYAVGLRAEHIGSYGVSGYPHLQDPTTSYPEEGGSG